MTWAEFKKFSGIITVLISVMSAGLAALAYASTRNDFENADVKESAAVKAIVEEHGKALMRIEGKIDTLLLERAK